MTRVRWRSHVLHTLGYKKPRAPPNCGANAILKTLASWCTDVMYQLSCVRDLHTLASPSTCMNTWIHTYIHAICIVICGICWIHSLDVYLFVCVCTHMCMQTYVDIFIRAHGFVYIHLYLYTLVCLSVRMCLLDNITYTPIDHDASMLETTCVSHFGLQEHRVPSNCAAYVVGPHISIMIYGCSVHDIQTLASLEHPCKDTRTYIHAFAWWWAYAMYLCMYIPVYICALICVCIHMTGHFHALTYSCIHLHIWIFIFAGTSLSLLIHVCTLDVITYTSEIRARVRQRLHVCHNLVVRA